MRKSYALFVPLLLLTVTSWHGASGQKPDTKQQKTCPYIISPKHPTDSLGEVVYEVQGDDQKDIPAVAGACQPPKVVKTVDPKFPKSLIKAKESADVMITCVVTAQGTVVDASANDGANPDAAKAAIDAVLQYKMNPATLDGKPIAETIQIKVHFGLRKYGSWSKKEYPATS